MYLLLQLIGYVSSFTIFASRPKICVRNTTVDSPREQDSTRENAGRSLLGSF
jgi:hypothetical protein